MKITKKNLENIIEQEILALLKEQKQDGPADGGFTDAERALSGPTNKYMGPTRLLAALKPMLDSIDALDKAMEDMKVSDVDSYNYLRDDYRMGLEYLESFARGVQDVNQHATKDDYNKSGDPTALDKDYMIKRRDQWDGNPNITFKDTQAAKRLAQLKKLKNK